MDSAKPVRYNVIKNILSVIDTTRLNVENFEKDETFVVIPLSKGSTISQHVKNSNTIMYLLIVENSYHKIRRADLALFDFRSPKVSLPTNSFYHIYNSDAISEDGTYTLITLGDVKQYEIDFCNKKIVAFRLWPCRQSTKSLCKDCFLETTLYNDYQYFNDLNCIQTISTSLGMSCNDCPPGFKCD